MKQYRKLFLIAVLILIIPLVLIACDSDDDKKDDSDNTSGGNDSAVGTELNESIESGALKAQYPSSWTANEAMGTITLTDTSNPEAAVSMSIMTSPLSGVSAKQTFETMATGLGADASSMETITVGGNEAYRLDYAAVTGGDGIMIGFESNDTLILLTAAGAAGKLADYETTILVIAEAIEYTP